METPSCNASVARNNYNNSKKKSVPSCPVPVHTMDVCQVNAITPPSIIGSGFGSSALPMLWGLIVVVGVCERKVC